MIIYHEKICKLSYASQGNGIEYVKRKFWNINYSSKSEINVVPGSVALPNLSCIGNFFWWGACSLFLKPLSVVQFLLIPILHDRRNPAIHIALFTNPKIEMCLCDAHVCHPHAWAICPEGGEQAKPLLLAPTPHPHEWAPMHARQLGGGATPPLGMSPNLRSIPTSSGAGCKPIECSKAGCGQALGAGLVKGSPGRCCGVGCPLCPPSIVALWVDTCGTCQGRLLAPSWCKAHGQRE